MNHPIIVYAAHANHDRSREQIEDHFLRGARFHARGSGDRFGAGFGSDGNAALLRQWRIFVRGDADGERAALFGEGDGAENVGRGAAGGDADNYIAAGNFCVLQIM